MRDPVADILAESGMAHDAALGQALESLRALSPAEAPEPSGALAEFLAGVGGSSAPFVGAAPTRAGSRAAEAALEKLAVPIELAAVRAAPRKRHRGAMISAAVVAGVGLSASGVAALGGVDYSGDAPSSSVRSAAAPAKAAQSSAGQSTPTAQEPPAVVPVSHDTPADSPQQPAAPAATDAGGAGTPRHRADDPAQRLGDDARNALTAAETMIAQAVRGSAGRHSAESTNDDEASAGAAQSHSQGANAGGRWPSGGASQPSQQGPEKGGGQPAAAPGQQANQPGEPGLALPELGIPQAAALQGGPRHLKAPQVLGGGL